MQTTVDSVERKKPFRHLLAAAWFYRLGFAAAQCMPTVVLYGVADFLVRYRYKVCVNMVDPQATHLLHEIFGGCLRFPIYKKLNRRPLFDWSVSERRAANCVRKLLPYLRIKKHRGELLLEFSEMCAQHSHRGRGYRVSGVEKAKRFEIIGQVRAENGRLPDREPVAIQRVGGLI